MRRWLAPQRSLLALLFAVQAVGVWVPLADARLEAGSADLPLDARRGEDGERGEDGRRAHLHEHCALCMHLAQREILPEAPPALDVPATRDRPRHALLADVPSPPPAPRHDARGPPSRLSS